MKQRADHREHLDGQREQEQLRRASARRPTICPSSARMLHARRRLRGLEAAQWRQLERHAGEMPRHFRQRQPAHADGGIVDHDAWLPARS